MYIPPIPPVCPVPWMGGGGKKNHQGFPLAGLTPTIHRGRNYITIGGNYIPLWVQQLAYLNDWILGPEGGRKSFFLKGHRGPWLSYFRPKEKLLRYSTQLCLGFITENKIFGNPVTPHRIEFRHDTDLTEVNAEPQQIQHRKVIGKGLSSVSAKWWQVVDRRLF